GYLSQARDSATNGDFDEARKIVGNLIKANYNFDDSQIPNFLTDYLMKGLGEAGRVKQRFEKVHSDDGFARMGISQQADYLYKRYTNPNISHSEKDAMDVMVFLLAAR